MEPKTKDKPTVGFGLLQDLGEGQTCIDLFHAIDEVRKAAAATGKKGSVTLKLAIIPQYSDGGQLRLKIDGAVSSTSPKPTRVASVYYVDQRSDLLSRRDPRQPVLPGILDIQAAMGPPLDADPVDDDGEDDADANHA